LCVCVCFSSSFWRIICITCVCRLLSPTNRILGSQVEIDLSGNFILKDR
jgi:hypothetical protein